MSIEERPSITNAEKAALIAQGKTIVTVHGGAFKVKSATNDVVVVREK